VTGAGKVIVVTINYRLGALGFLRHESSHDPYAGNFALADHQAALRWVRTNIGAFGGDSRNVTLWGESFGSFSVCAQLASPAARGLFDKAIVQSASCANNLVTRDEADRRGRQAVAALGRPAVTCHWAPRTGTTSRTSSTRTSATRRQTARRPAGRAWPPN
jgi:para-nitrobenzyl esterase